VDTPYPNNNATPDTPAGTVNGVGFDNIDMSGTPPASGPHALSANGAGPTLTLTANFTFNDSRAQRSTNTIVGTDAANLSAVADEFFYIGSADGHSPVTLAFASLGVNEGDELYVQLIGGDPGWSGNISVSTNGASMGTWTSVGDGDNTTASLFAFVTTAGAGGSLSLGLSGGLGGVAGVIISAESAIAPPSEGGTVGVETIVLNVADNVGAIQWQSSSNNSTWNDVVGATFSTLDVTALWTNTPFFRVEATSGANAPAYSTTLEVTSQGAPYGTMILIR